MKRDNFFLVCATVIVLALFILSLGVTEEFKEYTKITRDGDRSTLVKVGGGVLERLSSFAILLEKQFSAEHFDQILKIVKFYYPEGDGAKNLRVYAVGRVEGLEGGVHLYNIHMSDLIVYSKDSVKGKFSEVDGLKSGSFYLVFTAVYDKDSQELSQEDYRMIHINTLSLANSVNTQLSRLRIQNVGVNDFDQTKINEILKLPPDQTPLYVIII